MMAVTDRIRAFFLRPAMLFYPVWLVLTVLVWTAAPRPGIWGYLCLAALPVYALRPGSVLHKATLEPMTGLKGAVIGAVCAAVTASCLVPMGYIPLWNGEVPGHRNQYELTAEAFLEGRLYLEYGDEEELLKLENPYDRQERKEKGVAYHWDHAWYNGRYYMYFGVAPVLLVFLPYRVLTGRSLTTYHATQIFTGLAVVGIFALFTFLGRRFFRKLPLSVLLLLSTAFSVMSVWYAVAEPALYCTAISSAVALEIWSLFLFLRAVWGEGSENRRIARAFWGALLGALTFACRPTVGLANLLVLPLLAVFLRERKLTVKLLGKLCLAALPYAVVAAGLMVYNYVRFEDPFEFGQAYQLTVTDQSGYDLSVSWQELWRIVVNTADSFFHIGPVKKSFPYMSAGGVAYNGVFFNFPILLLGVFGLGPAALKKARQEKLLPLTVWFAVAVLAVTAVDILWSPYLLERYHMDIYFLMGIGCFISLGLWICTRGEREKNAAAFAVSVFALLAVLSSYLQYVGFAYYSYPEKLAALAAALGLK